MTDNAGATGRTRQQLEDKLAETEAQIREMERQHLGLVLAEQGSNADDEHDPEGVTLAFERQQLVAVLAHYHQTRADVLRALAGGYGVCETCGGAIGAERLEARPSSRSCISCAAAGRSGR